MLQEIESINAEIKRNNNRNNRLRNRVKTIESQLQQYLVHNKKDGVKCDGQIVTVEKKIQRKKKKKKDKEHEMEALINEYGIRDVDNFKKRIENIQKGEENVIEKVKYKKMKDDRKN
jgi:hypothetical protein